MSKVLMCPICRKSALQYYEESALSYGAHCSNCRTNMTMKTTAGKVSEIIIPSVGVIAGATAILKFMEIDNMSDLTDSIHDAIAELGLADFFT
jgi:hypothetical protein